LVQRFSAVAVAVKMISPKVAALMPAKLPKRLLQYQLQWQRYNADAKRSPDRF
jgi:hypothetical protein